MSHAVRTRIAKASKSLVCKSLILQNAVSRPSVWLPNCIFTLVPGLIVSQTTVVSQIFLPALCVDLDNPELLRLRSA